MRGGFRGAKPLVSNDDIFSADGIKSWNAGRRGLSVSDLIGVYSTRERPKEKPKQVRTRLARCSKGHVVGRGADRGDRGMDWRV